MIITVSDIARAAGGTLNGSGKPLIDTILIDSRKATQISSSTLFFALKGARSDGHRYIGQLYSAGVRAFVVGAGFIGSESDGYDDASFIEVEDTLDALQRVAAWKRNLYEGMVIAITGSNGKTIVKEWLSDIIGTQATVIRSPRSYNSQTGVPLSVWRVDPRYDYAVIEAGMSMPGEIARLEKIIRPDLGIFTNIGEAHQENFNSLEEKIREKAELFRSCSTIIRQVDQPEVNRVFETLSFLKEKKVITWSLEGNRADYNFGLSNGPKGTRILGIDLQGRRVEAELFSNDRATAGNLATLITTLLTLGFRPELVESSIRLLTPVEMRMEQKEGINGCRLVEDYYNSDPGALGIALDFLGSLPASRRTVIISDFVQVKGEKGRVYADVAGMLARSGTDRIICVGEELMASKAHFPDDTLFFPDTDHLVRWFDPGAFRNETILLKGARKFEFERVGELLQLKAHLTRLEINLENLLWNLNLLRSKLGNGTMTMAMVKAFAYGAGPREMSEWLINNSVDYLAVAYADEGVSLREAGIAARIMIMNPDPAAFQSIINYDLEPEIYSMELLGRFINAVRRTGLSAYPVHIKCDTGMHRLGFMESEAAGLADLLASSPEVRVASVFSHLAGAEDSRHDELTRRQAELFGSFADTIEAAVKYPFIRHLLNSAGVIRFPEYRFDMVRLGIGLFGADMSSLPGSKNVLAFRSHVSQVKRVPAGDGIGYGFKDVAAHDRDIAVIPVGYADGLNRRLGRGKLSLLINGERAAVTGEVCMDMCMADVTSMNVRPGDSVEIFGDNIPVSELAALSDTIPHEIITAISPRVKRVFLYS